MRFVFEVAAIGLLQRCLQGERLVGVAGGKW
jgi:hypothetical protein